MNLSLISIIEGTYNEVGISDITRIPSGFFAGCTIIGSIYLSNVTDIGKYAFLSASLPTSGLASLSNIVNIGSYAFKYCRGLQNFTLNINQFGEQAFYNCSASSVLITCSDIPSEAFFHCDYLYNVTINGCTAIRISAFQNCSKLTSINLINPNILSTINTNAFNGCSSLIDITTLSMVTALGMSVFEGCQKIQAAVFNYISSVPSYCFRDCYAMSTAQFASCLTMGSHAFTRCYSLKALNFPLCTSIASYGFYYCSGLTTITSTTFPKCTFIGNYAFSACTSLTTVSMYSVSSVGQEAFWGCSSLTTVRISRCLYIGSYAFEQCSKLSSIYINTNVSSQICTLANSNAFLNTLITSTTGRIVVPNALRASYKAAPNWAYFSNRIYSN